MAGEEGDKFFNLEDLNADYGRNTRVNRINGQRSYSVNQDEPITSVHPSNSMLTKSTPNIVRLVEKRRKLGDLPRLCHLNETAAKCSSPIVTPRSNSRVNYMNPLEGSQDRIPLSDVTNSGSASFSRNMLREETRSNINDVSLNGREPLNRKGKENYPGFGRELFADEMVSDDEEESNDFNEDCNLMQSRRAPRRVVPEEYASLGGPTAICAMRLPQIPPTPEYLLDLYNEKKRGPTFHRLIRLYNAIFAFTSTGGNIDHSINNGRAPYVYRLNGQNHHVFGSLIPNDNETPKFCQLYIYDTINEVDNRLRWVSVHDRESVDKEVVRGLITMLDETKQLVGEFRQHRDLYESDEIVELQITLKVIRSESGRECHISSTDEVAGIMVGDTEETCGDRDIVVNEKGKGLVRVSYVHPKLMALQSVSRGDVDSSNTGKGIVLPAGYVGSKRYMQQNFQDALKMMEYVPGCIAPNYPDIISRVFRLKLDQLMVDIKDKKHFGVCIGVMYCARTTFDDSGFPMYMRRRTNITVEIKKAELDNYLKYLFKYCLKGHDRVTVHVQRKRKRQANDTDEGGIDEINAYFDGRYLCGAESAYRIFGFPIHHRSISVERLQFYLPGEKNCTFRANEALGKVVAREKNKFSKLEAFFYLNSVDVNARKYTYDEIPQFYVWNDGERKWTMRKHGFQIGRLCYVHHSTGEPWFLRLLLTKVRGATSFESLRTVNVVCYSIFRDACKECGLLDDDKEWHEVLTQDSAGGLPPQFYALGEIDELLRSVGKSLKKFDQLPQPPRSYLNNETNNLIIEETSYDTRKMEYETAKYYRTVQRSRGKYMMHGGCGKTFLWRTLICKLRSQGKILLSVASSGIAATLMPGGRTAHSRFKIPIVLDECSTCNIAHDSDVAQLIKQTQLIIWDEAPMQHKYAFECIDRSLKDIMKAVDPERYTMPFGGITVALGGDFRQILPVITYGDRTDIVAACITRSRLWSICQVSPPRVCNFPVTENQILIPSQFCDVQTKNTVDNMICSTYPNFAHKGHNTQYLSERAILTPTNQTVGHLNSLIVDKLPRESVSYFNVDSAEEFGGTDEDLNEAFPIEYLNSLNVAGMPSHDLKLKVGVVVMLSHFIARMELSPSDTMMPFKLVRKQMPLQICYTMTINKSQGQSLKTVKLYLPKSVFSHGQYYVVISRVTSPTGLTIFVDDESGAATNIIQNVVYKEVFYGLPEA
ncbi:uncharacterized protein LOC141691172 [Apium graveolens]|uniref:uncharacterized protein LOC141691172 n=1 Tax=Apium graveolens TaxID=4045 RepID=UPI003D7BA7E1